MNLPEDLLIPEDTKAEEVAAARQEAALNETFALSAEPTKVTHGIDHIKTRLILATTAWNNVFGARNKQTLLTTLFVSEQWPNLKDRVEADVKADAAELLEVVWKPVQYVINEIVTNKVDYQGKCFAAVLTSGAYVYITMANNNFYLLDGKDEPTIPATKIIMLRETGVTNYGEQVLDLDDSKYVRTAVPVKAVSKPRYLIKEAADARHDKNKLTKRRKANKAAAKQRTKSRK